MTTIVYKDGVLAADTQIVTHQDILCGQITKIVKKGNCMGGAAGTLGDVEKFLCWIKGGVEKDLPEFSENISGILIDGGKLYRVEKDGVVVLYEAPFIAIGSGYEIALGAMAHGAGAEEAVEIAIQFDTISGGEVETLMLQNLLLVED